MKTWLMRTTTGPKMFWDCNAESPVTAGALFIEEFFPEEASKHATIKDKGHAADVAVEGVRFRLERAA